jgi:DNA-binding transcriptional MerR regulator
MAPTAEHIEARALALYEVDNKADLARTARALGWTGDEARTPKMTLARFVAEHESDDYAARVRKLEDQGMTTSDAQAVVDAEDQQRARSVNAALTKDAPKADATKPAQQIEAALRAILASMPQQLDEDAVRALIAEGIENQRSALENSITEALGKIAPPEPVRIVITAQGETRIDEHTHPVFEKA